MGPRYIPRNVFAKNELLGKFGFRSPVFIKKCFTGKKRQLFRSRRQIVCLTNTSADHSHIYSHEKQIAPPRELYRYYIKLSA